jgi:hypothetical protein
MLTVVVGVAQFEGIAEAAMSDWRDEEGDLPAPRFRVVHRRPLGDFENGTEVVRIHILNDVVPMNLAAVYTYLRVNLVMAFNVLFGGGPEAGLPVVLTLAWITNAVDGVLSEFR